MTFPTSTASEVALIIEATVAISSGHRQPAADGKLSSHRRYHLSNAVSKRCKAIVVAALRRWADASPLSCEAPSSPCNVSWFIMISASTIWLSVHSIDGRPGYFALTLQHIWPWWIKSFLSSVIGRGHNLISARWLPSCLITTRQNYMAYTVKVVDYFNFPSILPNYRWRNLLSVYWYLSRHTKIA